MGFGHQDKDFGKFFTRAHQVVVKGTVVQESLKRRRRDPISRHSVTSLGTVPKKSWDIAVWGQSWSNTVLGQSWDRAVLGQSWDSAVLGQSWSRAVLVRNSLGTLVLGQWSWDSGLGTVVLGH